VATCCRVIGVLIQNGMAYGLCRHLNYVYRRDPTRGREMAAALGIRFKAPDEVRDCWVRLVTDASKAIGSRETSILLDLLLVHYTGAVQVRNVPELPQY